MRFKLILQALAFSAAAAAATAAHAESFGAIAYSEPEGNWGFFFNAASQADAEARAVEYCQQNGGSACASSTWFTGCGSLARGTGNRWATSYGLDYGSAKFNALDACVRQHGTNCSTLVTVCAADGPLTDGVGPTPIDVNFQQSVVDYARARLGQQVGNGECWTLVNEALGYAGARQPNTAGLGLYEFGPQIFRNYFAGDTLQFEDVEFHYGDGRVENYPHHTAIIESVSGTTILLLNQNVNGNRTVQRSTIDLAVQTQGTIRAYRPQRR